MKVCELCGRDQSKPRKARHLVLGPSWENEDMCPCCSACYCEDCQELNKGENHENK